MKRVADIIKTQVLNSIQPSIKSALWLLRLMLPILLLVSLLDYFGVITSLSQYTTPIFRLIGLDGRAAFVYITSALTNIYSAIGVMTLFGFELREVTIMASMCLIAHNLIIEGAIQSRTGVSFGGITLLRIISSLLCGYLLNLVLPSEMSGRLFLEVATTKAQSISELLIMWIKSGVSLSIKVTIIIYLLNVLQNLLKAFNLISLMTKCLHPLLMLLGLPRSTSFLWIVANSLGLAYGGAIIIEEVEKGEMTRRDSALLNISLAQTHSLIEDTILFVAIGVNVWWLILPRLTLSILSVWGQRAITALRGEKSQYFKPTHP
ncbi:MAG: nucleoside recognition domain-containing protein [Rikenellaceae bacterium]